VSLCAGVRCVTCTLSFYHLHLSPPSAISTLSLHDALPICPRRGAPPAGPGVAASPRWGSSSSSIAKADDARADVIAGHATAEARSEEHTSELQSHLNLVSRLLLEKKN